MAYISTQSSAAERSAQNGIFAALATRFARFRVYRQTMSELSALSNAELADLGLSRCMIKHLAREAARAV